jgi:hypothetical protein
MRTNKLKPGDRVKVYGCSAHFKHHGDIGKVARICADPDWVVIDNITRGYVLSVANVHFRQCVKLKKREKK